MLPDLPPDDRLLIRTPRLDLVPLVAADAIDLFPVLDDAALGRWTGEAPPPDIETLRARLVVWETRRAPDGAELWLNWTMRRREDGSALGHLQATVTADAAAIAWVVGTAFHRQGFATEAGGALVGWLRGSLGVTVIEASIHPGNVASQTVASRAGLRATGRVLDGEVVWVLERHIVPSSQG
ncbi:MAG: GNAT family N-acetyltransferase [Actinomycetota bacterium]